MPAATTVAPKRVLLAAPRGYCAGVDRAVQAVERALELHGAPIYVRKEIVHNKHVVEELAKRGAIFVEEETEVPEGAIVVFSAHGVAPSVHENAASRGLQTIDATCPLVTKVHVSARRFAAQGYTIIMIGHQGHEEVEGTTGEAPDSIVLIETADEVETLAVPDPDKVAFITQTTLSVDETAEVISALRAKFPAIVSSKSDDICYATTNRQIAVKQLARECDLVLVIGSTNSSNSNRLVEVAREHGAASHLIDFHHQVREEWLEGVETVGITSGASAPEELVENLVAFFREIPWDLEQAAQVDGATPFQAFRKVILPLAAPGVFTAAILVFIFAWNDFVFAISLTSSDASRTVPAALAFFTGESTFTEPTGSIAAAAVVVTIPIIIFVLFFQRRIVAGLTAGAVKG